MYLWTGLWFAGFAAVFIFWILHQIWWGFLHPRLVSP